LIANGVKKVIPAAGVLEDAYRRDHAILTINAKLSPIASDAIVDASRIAVPASLEQQVNRLLKGNPAMTWDAAVAQIVAKGVRQ
jgi:hypothetical protein